MKKLFKTKKTKSKPLSVKGISGGEVVVMKPDHLVVCPDGGDVTFITGKGSSKGRDGSMVMELANGTELVRFDANGTLSVLGEPIPFEKVRDFLRSLRDPDPCSCPTKQLLNGGCICDGA